MEDRMKNEEAVAKLVELLANYARTCVLPEDTDKYTEAIAMACAALVNHAG